MLKATGKLISWLGGDPDGLGEKYLTWTYAELRDKTDNPLKSFTGTLDFLDGDNTGSYRLSYAVFRVEDP